MDEVYDIGQAVYVTDKKVREEMERKCGEELNYFGRVTGNNNPKMYLVEFFGKSTKSFQIFTIDADKLAKPSQDTNEFANIVPDRLDYKNCKENNDAILSVRPEDVPDV